MAEATERERSGPEILVIGGDGRAAVGRLVSLDGDVARVWFPPGEAPRIDAGVGGAVEVGLPDEGQLGSSRAPAVATELPDQSPDGLHAFRVVASGAAGVEVVRRLIALSFECGRSSLVQPHPGQPVEVLLGRGETRPWLRGDLCDVSLAALSVYVDARSVAAADLGSTQIVRLKLPVQSGPMTVPCKVHHLCQLGERRHVGLSIEYGQGADAGSIRAAILDYAAARQLDLIRAAQI